jgi:hypothetical protein
MRGMIRETEQNKEEKEEEEGNIFIYVPIVNTSFWYSIGKMSAALSHRA